METKKASDLMIPLDEYPHIPYWFSLRQALAELENAEFNVGGRKSLPRVVLVFNESYELLGTVRRRDILRGLDPESLANILLPRLLGDQGTSPEAVRAALSQAILSKAQRPVSDVMCPIRESVDHNDDIPKVIAKIVNHDLSLIPVLRNGEVVGVVRTVELTHELMTMCDFGKPDEKQR
jgi:CBS domain-containing protein